MDLSSILTILKDFGFPIAVACWALWRLEKSSSNGENIKNTLEQIDESIDRVQLTLDKITDIQHELVTTTKILYAIATDRRGSEKDGN